MVLPGSEGLPIDRYDGIADVFGSPVRNGYGATEFIPLAYGCARHWLHVNADWAIVEPVDAEYRPVPPGTTSHTVLLTNLANRIQPVLRYDLGDAIDTRPDPCECGNPLPAIRVTGRAATPLAFHAANGVPVDISPLALGTLMDRTPGIALYQLEQTTSTHLRFRVRPSPGTDLSQVRQAVHDELFTLFAKHGLDSVTIDHDPRPPEASPSGKYRRIIAPPAG